MSRTLLTLSEIKTLITLQRKVYAFITLLINSEAVASKLKYPQIPSILSESLAIHLLLRT